MLNFLISPFFNIMRSSALFNSFLGRPLDGGSALFVLSNEEETKWGKLPAIQIDSSDGRGFPGS